VKPASASGINSIGSPFGRLVEQSEPRVPQRMPAAVSVPPTGRVIVKSCPDDGRLRIRRIAAATTIAMTSGTATASTAHR
jgi:hypothetical protein